MLVMVMMVVVLMVRMIKSHSVDNDGTLISGDDIFKVEFLIMSGKTS
jgi:hypothetical protein